MKHGKVVGVAVGFLIVLMLGTLVYFNPSILNGLKPNTIITPPTTITQAETGVQEGSDGSVTGVYWTMTATADFNQPQENGYLLTNGQTAPITIQGIQQTIATKASVEVDITPLQPYITKDLAVAQTTFANQAVSTNGQVTNPARGVLSYYNWYSQGGPWFVYTPYQITVLVNGQQLGSTTFNSQGSGQQQSISTSAGTILINNLGSLSGTWTAPNAPASICIVNNNFIYSLDSSLLTRLNGATPNVGSYSDYWYGVSRNSANQIINPTLTLAGGLTNQYPPSSYGGWEGSNYGGSVTAVPPVVAQSQLSTLPSDKQSYQSLEQWLATKVTNYASNGGVFYPGNQYTSIQITTDPSNGKDEMMLNVPFRAYGTPVFNIEVPASMANTWVTVMPESNIQVAAHWDSNAQNTIDTATSQTLDVVCTQQSTVTSAANIVATSSDPRTVINGQPSGSDYVNLAPGASQTLQFAVGQTGGTTQEKGVVITVTSSDTVTGAVHSTCTITITWEATVGSGGATTLNVYVLDNKTAYVPELQVNIEYPPSNGQTETVNTNANGLAAFTLADVSGGGYGGKVYIQTQVTSQYASVSKTVSVIAGIQNNVYITLGLTPKAPGLSLIDILLIVVIAVVTIMFGIVIYYVHKKVS